MTNPGEAISEKPRSEVLADLFVQVLDFDYANGGRHNLHFGSARPYVEFIDDENMPSFAVRAIHHSRSAKGRPTTELLTGTITDAGIDYTLEPTNLYHVADAPGKLLTFGNVIDDLLPLADDEAAKKLAEKALRYRVLGGSRLPSQTARVPALLSAFQQHGKLDILLDAAQAESRARRVPDLNWHIVHYATALRAKTDRAQDGLELTTKIAERGIFKAEQLTSVAMMSNGEIAEHVLTRLGPDPFKDIKPTARRNMANLLLEKILKEAALPDSDRNSHNSGIILKTLFDQKLRKTLAMNDVIILANGITTRLNESRPGERKQDLLPIGQEGPAQLVNCGEAIFRVLELTASTPKHTRHNRNFAEIFDLLMAPYYAQFAKTRPVTIADICARYPDVKGELLVELHDIARHEGYPAASRRYRALDRQQTRTQRRDDMVRPGYGVIS